MDRVVRERLSVGVPEREAGSRSAWWPVQSPILSDIRTGKLV